MAGIALTPTQRSALLQRLLQQQDTRGPNPQTGLELALRMGAQGLRQNQLNKLLEQQSQAEGQSNRRIAEALAGNQGRQLLDLESVEGPAQTLSIPQKRGAAGRQRQQTNMANLRPEELAQVLGIQSVQKELAEPGFAKQTEIRTEAEKALIEERGEESRETQAQALEARSREAGRDRQFRGSENQKDRELRQRLAEDERLFEIKLTELAKEAKAGGLDLTQDQANAAAFGVRAENSSMVIDQFGDQFTGFSSRIGVLKPQELRSDERQRFNQAKRNFINAILRRESGASISKSEFANADQQYFPQPGDDDAVLEQKRLNRQTMIEGLKLSSGGGYEVLRARVPTPDFDDAAEPAGPNIQEGTTATNPDTGERVVFRDGKWVPM